MRYIVSDEELRLINKRREFWGAPPATREDFERKDEPEE